MSEILKELNNMQEVNDFLKTELGGRTLEEAKIPKDAPKDFKEHLKNNNAQVRMQVAQFEEKWKSGHKIICIKNKCLCGRQFWEPHLQILTEDNPTYTKAKKGEQQVGSCGICHGIMHRMRELGLQPSYAKGIITAIWNSLQGAQTIQDKDTIGMKKDLDIKHLMDIGYKAEVVLFEPKEGVEAAEKKWQEQQDEIKKQHEELNKNAKKK